MLVSKLQTSLELVIETNYAPLMSSKHGAFLATEQLSGQWPSMPSPLTSDHGQAKSRS